MSDSVDRVFVHALNTVKRIPRTGSARPPEADRLKLYGLYKQSTEGNVEGLMPRPQGNNKDEIAVREKWDAWHTFADLSRTEAKRQYISTLIATMHRYATTTPEARELVSELEFVWDQIKSNSASYASSSPGQQEGERDNSRRRRRREDSGEQHELLTAAAGPEEAAAAAATVESTMGQVLRRLRPTSDGDAEDEDNSDSDDNGEPAAHQQGDPSAPAAATGLTLLSSSTQPNPDEAIITQDRKWRKRIESTLIKLSVEVAALREQQQNTEAAPRRRTTTRRSTTASGGGGPLSWLAWALGAFVRHVLVDAAVLAVLVLWGRRRRRGRRRIGVGGEDGVVLAVAAGGNGDGDQRLENSVRDVGAWLWDMVVKSRRR